MGHRPCWLLTGGQLRLLQSRGLVAGRHRELCCPGPGICRGTGEGGEQDVAKGRIAGGHGFTLRDGLGLVVICEAGHIRLRAKSTLEVRWFSEETEAQKRKGTV